MPCRVLSIQPMFLPKYFDIPLEGEYSGGLDAFILLFKHNFYTSYSQGYDEGVPMVPRSKRFMER